MRCADKKTVRNNEKRIETARSGGARRFRFYSVFPFSFFASSPRPSATHRREMPSAGHATPWRVHAHLAQRSRSSRVGGTDLLRRTIASDADRHSMDSKGKRKTNRVRRAQSARQSPSPIRFSFLRCSFPTSSPVGDTPPRDALRGTRDAVTFPCAPSASRDASRRARQACSCEPSRATRRTAQPETHRRRAIRVAGAKKRTPRPSATDRREMRFPRRRAGSHAARVSRTGSQMIGSALSAKRTRARLSQLQLRHGRLTRQ